MCATPSTQPPDADDGHAGGGGGQWHAIGAGLELALSADLAIVAEEAKLRLPEIALGTFLGGGVVYTLAERVGVLRARELIYLGDFFSGAEAARNGGGQPGAAGGGGSARGPGTGDAPGTPRADSTRGGQAPHRAGGHLSREQALARERAALEEIFRTDDWAEGVAAFREGRAPDYRGR